jgi:hypothetical protein
MGNPNYEAIARLEREHPGWQIWVVPRVYGGPVWCARPHGAPVAQLHADTPEHLSEYITEWQQGSGDAPRKLGSRGKAAWPVKPQNGSHPPSACRDRSCLRPRAGRTGKATMTAIKTDSMTAFTAGTAGAQDGK